MIPSMDAKQFTSYMEDQDSPDSKRYGGTEGIQQMQSNPSNKRTYMPPSLISYDRISFQRLNNEKQFFGPYQKSIVSPNKSTKRIGQLGKSLDFSRRKSIER